MGNLDPRAVTALDIPLVRRVIDEGLPLDTAAALTCGIHGLEDAALSAVPFADLGAPTLVLRNGHGGYVGQFRHRLGETIAQLTLLAPEPREGNCREWSRLIDSMVVQAGRRGAHLISAEVDEDHPGFVAFRMAGFAVYSRQVMLRRDPSPVRAGDRSLLRPELDEDAFAVATLHANTVPRLLQQAEPLPSAPGNGLIYERDGQIAGYLGVMEGKSGIVIKPFFHPEVYDQAAAVIQAALTYLPGAAVLPVYVYARAYQDWLRGVLEQVEFRPWTHQALLVKHTVVRLERPEPAAVPALEPSRRHTPVANGPINFQQLKRDNRLSRSKRGTMKLK